MCGTASWCWWFHQAGEEPSSSWLLDNPFPSTEESSALTRIQSGRVGIGALGSLKSLSPQTILSHLSWVALGALGVSCTSGALIPWRGGSWSLLQGEFGEQNWGKAGRTARKEQSSSLQSRLNDLHQAEGPWQENEVTSALNHSPED